VFCSHFAVDTSSLNPTTFQGAFTSSQMQEVSF